MTKEFETNPLFEHGISNANSFFGNLPLPKPFGDNHDWGVMVYILPKIQKAYEEGWVFESRVNRNGFEFLEGTTITAKLNKDEEETSKTFESFSDFCLWLYSL